MADKDKSKIDLGLLEEDDEFEEFPAEGNLKQFFIQFGLLFQIFTDWAESKDSEEDLSVWEDNWDDDNVSSLDPVVLKR